MEMLEAKDTDIHERARKFSFAHSSSITICTSLVQARIPEKCMTEGHLNFVLAKDAVTLSEKVWNLALNRLYSLFRILFNP